MLTAHSLARRTGSAQASPPLGEVGEHAVRVEVTLSEAARQPATTLATLAAKSASA